MNIILFSTFILTITTIIATPGPSVLLIITHSINNGYRAVFSNALGSAFAASLLMIVALFGIHSLLPDRFRPYIALLGSCYLIYLGIKNIKAQNEGLTGHTRKSGFFWESFFTGISNPKDIAFFVLFLPQFVDKKIEYMTSSLYLIIGWIICDFTIMTLYGTLAKNLSSNILLKKNINIISAIILISIGFFLMYTTIREF